MKRFRSPEVIFDREGKEGPYDYHTDLGCISAQLPSPSLPVLPPELGGCSPRSQTGVPGLPGCTINGHPPVTRPALQAVVEFEISNTNGVGDMVNQSLH